VSGEKVTLQDIYRARQAIASRVPRTPLLHSRALSAVAGGSVHLKLETLQETGSFKIRGATNRLAHMSAAERARGVVTYSSGNHGPAVAHAASQLGVRAVVCLSTLVPDNKIANVKNHGGEVHITGDSFDEAGLEAARLVAEEGMILVPAFDDPHVIAGQGTIALELLEDLPDLDSVLVPLSGGGLIGGIALALKAAAPGIRVIGITMEHGAAMYESQKAGKPIEIEEVPSLADALGGGLGPDNRYTFNLVHDFVDDIILVSERQIARGIRHAFREERLIVEGSGTVGMAALLEGLVENLGQRIALVVSGGNIDPDQLLEIVNGETPA